MIPKAGANTFSGELFLDGGRDTFADSNLTPELEAAGFAFAPTAWNYSLNPAFGGPLREDKLWFFGSYVRSRSKTYRTDIFFDPDEPSTPEGLGDDLRAFGEGTSSVQNIRITYQVSQANKVTSAFTAQQNDFGRVVGTGFGRVASEALFNGTSDPNYMSTTRWTSTPTDRVLIEADLLVPAAGPRVPRFRRKWRRPGGFQRTCHGAPVGHQHPPGLLHRGPPAHGKRVGLVRHRVAQLQGRLPVRQQHSVRPLEEQRRHLPGGHLQRLPALRTGNGQRGCGGSAQAELRVRHLRAGRLDGGPFHGEPGRALRLAQRLPGRGHPARRPLLAGDHRRPDQRPPGLERLERTLRRGLRPVR